MIDNIKTKAANLLLKSKIAKLKREVRSTGLESARSVGIVFHFDLKSDEVIRDFARFLKEERIKVETLGYISNKEWYDKAKPELDYQYFSKKEVNWLYVPQKKETLDFINKEFDILIDCSIHSYFPIRYILSLSKAKFKTGSNITYRAEVCDLTIDISSDKSIPFLIKQLKHYLSLIK